VFDELAIIGQQLSKDLIHSLREHAVLVLLEPIDPR